MKSSFNAQFRHCALVFVTLSDEDETLNTHLPGIPIQRRKLTNRTQFNPFKLVNQSIPVLRTVGWYSPTRLETLGGS